MTDASISGLSARCGSGLTCQRRDPAIMWATANRNAILRMIEQFEPHRGMAMQTEIVLHRLGQFRLFGLGFRVRRSLPLASRLRASARER